MKRGLLVRWRQMFDFGHEYEMLPVISMLGLPLELPFAKDMTV